VLSEITEVFETSNKIKPSKGASLK
jgi:hypothetical protein